MSTSTRIMRSEGKSDGLSLPTRTRPTRKDATSGRNGGTALNTAFNAGRDQQQWMLTQMPHLPTQSPQATSAERMEATAPMLPPGPHMFATIIFLSSANYSTFVHLEIKTFSIISHSFCVSSNFLKLQSKRL